MSGMRILHVIQRYYPFLGGSELYFQELSERMAADGHTVTVLTTDAWDLEHFWAPGRRRVERGDETHNGVHIMRFPVRRAPGPPIVYPIVRRLMVELGRLPGSVPLVRRMSELTPRVPALAHYLQTTAERFDVVNTTNITLDFMIFPVYRFACARKLPFVCTPFIHLGEPGSDYIVRYYGQPHQIDLLRRAQAVLVQTRREADFLAGRGVPRARMVEVGGWVQPETLVGGDGARFRATHRITAPIVLSIGAAAYDKGTMHVVEAMQQLWQSGVDAQLVLIASNVLSPFEHYWANLPQADRDRITLLRAAPHEAKLDALAAASVFALPSRTDSFGIVFLEAWTYGVPVIGANAGGVPDVIDDGRDGYLIPFGDIAQLAARIQQLLSEPERARLIGQRGRHKALETMTFEAAYRRVCSVYQTLSSGHIL
jgi:glycogen(starch) synthase